jgi:nicotinamide mononucleotide transporter
LFIIQQILATTDLEWIAFFTAIIQVILAWKNKVANFYFGIISVSIYTYLFFIAKLYAESLLNLYYLLISIYGIILWLKNNSAIDNNINPSSNLNITISNNKDWKICLTIIIGSFIILYTITKLFTKSNVPFADSLASAFAWGGTWLLAKRKLENWLVLNVSNAIAIPLFYYKQYYVTSILGIILFMVAIIGFMDWKKQMGYSQNT